MGKTIRIYVDESLQQVLERVRLEVANDMKKKYNLDEITIEGTLVSQILSARLKGQNSLSFNIRKKGLNKGVLELI